MQAKETGTGKVHEKPVWRRLAPFVLITLGMVVLGLLPPVREQLQPVALARWAHDLGGWAILAITLVAILSPLAFLPRAPIALVCGLWYGVLPGALLANSASLLGAWLQFRLSRRALGRMGRQHPLATRWREALANPRTAFLALFLLRAFPLSNFTATNILAGMLRMRVRVFLPASFLGMIPSTLFYACCGKVVRHPTREYYLLLGVLLLVLTFGTVIAGRRYLNHNEKQ
jgi:uncharacterized membrane protein YdjX (TVP38/TMEM64 family)